jgi:peptidase M28-like protein
VLFDGEESPRSAAEGEFLQAGLRGSKAYAAAHADELAAAVIVDFVGDRDLSLARESGSDPALWTKLRAAAKTVGVQRVFPDRVRGQIYDDHTPFSESGVPAIDLIDFDFPQFHTPGDNLAVVSPRSLDAVGETLWEMLQRGSQQTCHSG